MKFLTYNILFGMKGITAGSALMSNFAMHGLRPMLPCGTPEFLRNILVRRRSTHIPQVLELIRRHDPDVLCLNEVLKNIHGVELVSGLQMLGFNSLCWQPYGHHKPPFDIHLLVASKYPAEAVHLPISSLPQSGYGGVACGLYIPSHAMTVVGVHLAVSSIYKSLAILQTKQLGDLEKFVSQEAVKNRPLIVLGDFNLSLPELYSKCSVFKEYLSGVEKETYPSFRTIFNILPQKQFDHILWNEHFKLMNAISEIVSSDHQALVADLLL
jgi:endonuclease/exonuclease/phosphatase family metal-dependent hydrolase